MAQVDYFMTDAETAGLVRELVGSYGARFTPERHAARRFPTFTTAEDVAAHEQGGRFRTRYFVTSAAWGIHPFDVEELRHPTVHYFYLWQRYGGPYFDHLPSSLYADASAEWIVPGMFTDFPSYYRKRGGGGGGGNDIQR